MGVNGNLFIYGNAVTYYVSTTGNDETNDGSQNKPFKTITKAISLVSKYNNTSTINIASGTYNEKISISSQKNINIVGDTTGNVIVNEISIHASNIVDISNIQINGTTEHSCKINASTGVKLNNILVIGANKGSGFHINRSQAYLNGVCAINVDYLVIAIYNTVVSVGLSVINNNTPKANITAFDCYSSIIQLAGNVSTSQYNITNGQPYLQRAGGFIYTNSQPVGDTIINPTLSNGFVYAPAFDTENSRVYRIGKLINLDLKVRNPESKNPWTNILTLPVGYRPANHIQFPCIIGTNLISIVIYSSGEVQPVTNITANTTLNIHAVFPTLVLS